MEAKIQEAKDTILNFIGDEELKDTVRDAVNWEDMNSGLVDDLSREEVIALVNAIPGHGIAPADMRRWSRSKLLDSLARNKWGIGN